ncbi:MAG: DNA-directed RNA polymerase subunit E [Thermoplasmata archaeon]|nr:DNA-directed RNA polymerase subunit E [Thermoplasmata archaeon]RLF35435.1 MAG: DNA-directed RNA polymerase subunit E [Thermoplasmata archaeon]RLF39411.1 MAG: DNA-directed RNA polymerase subunit E [Thermoplasmata archaeon]HDM25336.1 DNA-directed RNA polymerase subunit E [Thermoplasmatales archaeon]
MKVLYACKNCHLITEKTECPVCSIPTSKKWKGCVIIFDPNQSQIAQKMNITKPGMYALKVR